MLDQQKCLSPAPGHSSKLTYTVVETDTCAFQKDCQLCCAASGMSLGLCLLTQFQLHEAIVLVSWRCCLSLEVVSSIPAGSTINYRFLGWFICDSRCQSIKIKRTYIYIYISAAPGRSSILTHIGVEIDTCAFKMGCQLSSAASGIGIVFIDTIAVAWSDRAGKLAMLPQPGGCEFNPRLVHEKLSLPLCVYIRFLVPEHQNQTNKNV